MKEYFVNVIWGVLFRPKKAIIYALNNSSPLHLTILILMAIWFGTYGTLLIENLFISNYISDMLMDILLFGLVFLLIYIFNKVVKTEATKKDLFFTILLMSIASIWISFSFILFAFLQVFFSTQVGFVWQYAYFIGLGFLLSFIYLLYILVQLLNKVQNAPMWKSVVVVFLTTFTLLFIVGTSKHLEKKQQDLMLSLYQNWSENTNNISKKLKYYMTITDLLEEQEQYEEAIEYYFKALKIEESDVTKSEHYYWIAEDYQKLGKIDDALKYAKKSLALSPEDEDSLEQVSELQSQKLEM